MLMMDKNNAQTNLIQKWLVGKGLAE